MEDPPEKQRTRRRHRRRRGGFGIWFKMIVTRDLWLYPVAVVISGAVAYWLLK